jgi:hypothetical protein
MAIAQRNWELAVDYSLDLLQRVSDINAGAASIGACLEKLVFQSSFTWVTFCALTSIALGSVCMFKSGLNTIQAWYVHKKIQTIFTNNMENKNAAFNELQIYLTELGEERTKKYFKEDLTDMHQRITDLAKASFNIQQQAINALQKQLCTTTCSFAADTVFYTVSLAGAVLLLSSFAVVTVVPFMFLAAVLGLAFKLGFEWKEKQNFKVNFYNLT